MLTDTERKQIFALSREAIAEASTKATQINNGLNACGYDINHRSDTDLSKSVYGFDVHHAARALAQERDHMRYLEAVALDALDLLKFCEERELPVIAVLPERVWTRICLEAKLYTLWPEYDGEVYLATEALDKCVRKALEKVSQRWFGVGPRKSHERFYAQLGKREVDEVKHYFKGRDREILLQELFPNYSSINNIINKYCSYAEKVRVEYPTPDVTFGIALTRVRGWGKTVSITLQGEAIDISGYIENRIQVAQYKCEKYAKNLAREQIKVMKRLIASFRVSDPDPILAIRKDRYSERPGAACAVIAQYGDWPLEFSAIEQALKEDLRM